jgi:hypothetical protein
MQIKAADDHRTDILVLQGLLERSSVNPATRGRIEAEIRQIKAGEKGERDAAYEIEFYFGRSTNLATIHDLRIEVDGFVAQIDHLLINRLGEIWVCESKHFAEGVSVDEHSEWFRWWKGRPEGIPSPIEQNHRHVFLLQRLFDDGSVAFPRRLGLIPMKPYLRSLVLVSNNARIGRPKRAVKGLDEVIKVEQLKTRVLDTFDASSPLRLGRIIGKEGLEAFARRLAAMHRPASFDWPKQFGLATGGPTAVASAPAVATGSAPSPDSQKRGFGHKCASCGVPVSFAVVRFCWNNKARFNDGIYCMTCQHVF